MIIGLRVDFCPIDRIKRACQGYGDRFLDRVLTPGEKAYSLKRNNPFPHIAGMFAAKEAARKAFGDGISGIGWTEIEIVHSISGRPMFDMHGFAKERLMEMGVQRTHLSITHDKLLAIAVAIFENAKCSLVP